MWTQSGSTPNASPRCNSLSGILYFKPFIFRFSSSLREQFYLLRSDGSTTLPGSSSEKCADTKTFPDNKQFIFFSLRYFRERSKSWKTLVKTEEEHVRQMEDYMALLLKLVRTKMHSESEASKIDSFKDLRVDIRNELSELKSTLSGCKVVEV